MLQELCPSTMKTWSSTQKKRTTGDSRIMQFMLDTIYAITSSINRMIDFLIIQVLPTSALLLAGSGFDLLGVTNPAPPCMSTRWDGSFFETPLSSPKT